MITLLLLALLLDPFADTTKKAVVIIFVRPDCPISNRYAPELKQIHDRYGEQGIGFYLVYPGPGISPESIDQHRREYSYPMPGLRDPDFRYVRLAGAKVTPEVAVFVGRRLVYRGRIDDRYVDFGRVRPNPTQHDLADLLAIVVAGKPVSFHETKAIGCSLEDLREAR